MSPLHVNLDGLRMTSRIALQNEFLIAFGLPGREEWDEAALRVEFREVVPSAEVHWRNVVEARAQAGDDAVDLLLALLAMRQAADERDRPVGERTTLTMDDPKLQVVLDGAAMTSPVAMQDQIQLAFDLPVDGSWSREALRDDLQWNARAADVVWRNVTLARVQAGDAAVEFVLGQFAERIERNTASRWPQNRMTLTLEA